MEYIKSPFLYYYTMKPQTKQYIANTIFTIVIFAFYFTFVLNTI